MAGASNITAFSEPVETTFARGTVNSISPEATFVSSYEHTVLARINLARVYNVS